MAGVLGAKTDMQGCQSANCINPTVRAEADTALAPLNRQVPWCGRRDSNPDGITPKGF